VTPLSRRLFVVNLILAACGLVFVAALAREMTRLHPLPSPPARRVQSAARIENVDPGASAGDALAAYNVVVSKTLFNPSRTESHESPVTAARPLPPRPMLLGVVLDGKASLAYLEENNSRRVLGYRVGDSVAGGRLDRISDDKVVITRPDGAMEVMLLNPRVLASPAAATAGVRGGRPLPPTRALATPIPAGRRFFNRLRQR
jgi:hypothetical protein